MNNPRISILVAMDLNRLIGANNTVPWHISPDLRRFRQITMGHPIIMGRKTYDSIGRPLPGRTNVVISRNPTLEIPGCLTVTSLDQALALCDKEDEVFIIGGAEIYRLSLPITDRLHVTEILGQFQGDTWFPEIDHTEWKETFREPHPAEGPEGIAYHFVIYDRK